MKIGIPKFAIIILTDNHYSTLRNSINTIKNNIPSNIPTEIIVLQNISENKKNDSTSRKSNSNNTMHEQPSKFDISDEADSVSVTHIQYPVKGEKILSIMHGIKSSSRENIIVMTDDSSNPSKMIPRIMESFLNNGNCILVASQPNKDGLVNGKKNLDREFSSGELKIMDEFNPEIRDLNSDYIAFPRKLIDDIPMDRKGCTPFLEDLVKMSGLRIIRIPYTFVDNTKTRTKLISLVVDYAKSLLHHYKHGPKSKDDFTNLRYKNSVLFISKAIRFYTVGATGLLVNYTISSMLSNGMLLHLWYMEATVVGILASITSNFFLNKAWTFQDRDFSFYYTLRQYLLFSGICCFGALIQLGLVYLLVEGGSRYWTSLLFSIAVASISNFLLNKKWTFNERLWG